MLKLRNPHNLYSVEYDYSHYGCRDPEWCSQSDDYCRDSYFQDLHVVDGPVDGEAVLNEMNNYGRGGAIPDTVKEWAITTFNLNNPESYEALSEGDYYGDIARVYLICGDDIVAKINKKLEAYFGSDIHEYLKQKGHDVDVTAPAVDELKRTLKLENNNTESALVNSAKMAQIRNFKLGDIIVPNQKHLDEVEPIPTKFSGEQAIVGVLVNGVLVDGYHRLKGLPSHRKSAYFISMEG